jgi:hypothetical protein
MLEVTKPPSIPIEESHDSVNQPFWRKFWETWKKSDFERIVSIGDLRIRLEDLFIRPLFG